MSAHRAENEIMEIPTERNYVLATGDEAERRLEIVNAVHGPDTEQFLARAEIGPGQRVADIGCGIGVVTCYIADQIGPDGEAVGVDISAEQTRVAARRAAERGIANARFIAAPAEATGLPRASFDRVYARFLLMHLPDPEAALREMAALLRPGGMLLVEDGDFEGVYCSPHAVSFDRCFELYRSVIRQRGADPTIGMRLTSMVLSAGFPRCEVAIAQPVIRDGEAKRLPEWTLLEAREQIIAAGLATDAEINSIAADLMRLAADTTTRFGMAPMTQVRAVKPQSEA